MIMKKNIIRIEFNSGFTLLETLVAITIFTGAVLALLTILGNGISSTSFAKRKIIASYLAGEGMELVRNLRDNSVLYNSTDSDTGWTEFLNSLSTACGTAGCYVDDSQNLVACSGGVCPNLLYNSSTGSYNYTSGADSGYNRKITIEMVSSSERKIHGLVAWTQGSRNYQVDFTDNLLNWIEQ